MTQERFSKKTNFLVKMCGTEKQILWQSALSYTGNLLISTNHVPRVLYVFFILCAQSYFSPTTLQTYSICDVFDATLLLLRQAINYDTIRVCFLFLSNVRACILLLTPFPVTFTSRIPSHQSLFSC